MISFSKDVSLVGLKPEMAVVIAVMLGICYQSNYKITVTSICDKKHSTASLHYVGYALDFVIDIPEHHKYDYFFDYLKIR